jgi:hypothetical protein
MFQENKMREREGWGCSSVEELSLCTRLWVQASTQEKTIYIYVCTYAKNKNVLKKIKVVTKHGFILYLITLVSTACGFPRMASQVTWS